MEDYNVYDSVFKTIMQKIPRLVIPLVNEAFGRDYPLDEQVELLPTEYEVPRGYITADSVLRVGKRIYHIECQSAADPRMPIRMIEYNFAIAFEQADATGKVDSIDFPDSCVVYLRESAREPERPNMTLNMPDGEVFTFPVHALGAQSYGADELFERGLLALVPFYLMRYEKELSAIAADDERASALLAELADMRADLEAAALEMGDAGLYNELVSMSTRVSDHLLRSEGAFKREARSAMGGEVLLLLSEEKELAVNKAREEGIEAGREEGRQEGIEEGRQEGREEGRQEGREEGREAERMRLVARMRAQGVDDATIAAIVRE